MGLRRVGSATPSAGIPEDPSARLQALAARRREQQVACPSTVGVRPRTPVCSPSGRPGRSRPYVPALLRYHCQRVPSLRPPGFLHPCPRLCPPRQRGGASPPTPSRRASARPRTADSGVAIAAARDALCSPAHAEWRGSRRMGLRRAGSATPSAGIPEGLSACLPALAARWKDQHVACPCDGRCAAAGCHVQSIRPAGAIASVRPRVPSHHCQRVPSLRPPGFSAPVPSALPTSAARGRDSIDAFPPG
jgi:hypothetical protein